MRSDPPYEIRCGQICVVVVILLSTDRQTTEIGRELVVSKKVRQRPLWACPSMQEIGPLQTRTDHIGLFRRQVRVSDLICLWPPKS